MYRWCLGTVVIAALGLAGCQPGPLDDAAWPQERPLGEGLETDRPPAHPKTDDDSDKPAMAEPTGELTLRTAMAQALMKNPGLTAYAWETRAAEARMLQAGRWSNPELEFEMDEFGGTGDLSGTDAAEFALSLAQTFPLGGDIARRRELAGYEAKLAGWDYEAARLGVLTQVTRRYIAVLAAQRSVAAREHELGLTRTVLATTRKRMEAGAAAQVEVIRARVPVAEAKVRLEQARRRLATSRRQLALTWGQNEPSFGAVVGDLERLAAPPEPSALARHISRNPRVARWATEISARRAEAALARAEAVPDVTGRVGVKRFNGIDETALVVGVSLPLPIFDRRQGDILAARLGGSAAGQRRAEAERRLALELSDSWTQLANAYAEAVAIRDEALPPATEAFAVTRRAFEKGDVAFIDVLDAERTLVDLRIRYVAALVAYHTAAAEIEGLIAQPLAQIKTASGNLPTETKESSP